jgi:hypothetical protein
MAETSNLDTESSHLDREEKKEQIKGYNSIDIEPIGNQESTEYIEPFIKTIMELNEPEIFKYQRAMARYVLQKTNIRDILKRSYEIRSNIKEYNNILISVQSEYVSPNLLQKRFLSQKIFVRLTQNCKILNDAIDSMKTNKLFVTGPIGIGKSYCLLHFVLSCRRHNGWCRILYINNPQQLIDKWTPYLFMEMIYAFGSNWLSIDATEFRGRMVKALQNISKETKLSIDKEDQESSETGNASSFSISFETSSVTEDCIEGLLQNLYDYITNISDSDRVMLIILKE